MNLQLNSDPTFCFFFFVFFFFSFLFFPLFVYLVLNIILFTKKKQSSRDECHFDGFDHLHYTYIFQFISTKYILLSEIIFKQIHLTNFHSDSNHQPTGFLTIHHNR
jgi:hypothetical protein